MGGVTTEARGGLARERAALRVELLAWLRVARDRSRAYRELAPPAGSGDPERLALERGFEAAVSAAERIAGLLRTLPQEELPADWLKVVGG